LQWDFAAEDAIAILGLFQVKARGVQLEQALILEQSYAYALEWLVADSDGVGIGMAFQFNGGGSHKYREQEQEQAGPAMPGGRRIRRPVGDSCHAYCSRGSAIPYPVDFIFFCNRALRVSIAACRNKSNVQPVANPTRSITIW
jgi:hypothetical protein